MSSTRDRFKERFARQDKREKGQSASAPHRRKDFKGARRRLNLRLSEELARDLDVLQLAEGLEKNAFCEEVIREAVDRRLASIRQRLGEQAWGELVGRAEGRATAKLDD